MVTSAFEKEQRTRWIMWAVELVLIFGGMAVGWGVMVEKVGNLRKDVEAKCDEKVFNLHRSDDDKRFDDFREVTKQINNKLDKLIERQK